MGFYQFAGEIGELGADRFDAVLEDYRSDAEQRFSQLQIHNPENPDLRLARALAEEIINISGAEIKLYVRTENADYDMVWDEDPDPTYWQPVLLKGYFKPQPIQAELKKWGADIANNRMELVFSHRRIHELLGDRMVRVGDVVQVPFNAIPHNPTHFRIVNATPFGNFRYHWLYLQCQLEQLTADVTVDPTGVLPQNDDVDTGRMYHDGF